MKKNKFIEMQPTSVRFSRAERRRILSLSVDVSSYVRDATLNKLLKDERMIDYSKGSENE